MENIKEKGERKSPIVERIEAKHGYYTTTDICDEQYLIRYTSYVQKVTLAFVMPKRYYNEYLRQLKIRLGI